MNKKKKKNRGNGTDEEDDDNDNDDEDRNNNNNEFVSPHLRRQQAFLDSIDFQSPFDIEKYRPLLES